MIIEALVLALGVGSVASYETTGKGLADHTISAVSGKDCKIANTVHDKQLCETKSPYSNSAIADAERVFASRKK
jgi:hypothetical protein